MSKSYTTKGIYYSLQERVIGDSIVAFLKQRYPVKTADQVAADTGIPVYSVAKWLGGSTLPNAKALLTLTSAYGPAFLASTLPGLDWLDRDNRNARTAQLERDIAEKRRELEALR